MLRTILDDIHVKLSWQREIAGHGSEAYVIIEFEKIGLKLFNRLYSGFRISTKIPPDGEATTNPGNKKIQDILGDITEKTKAGKKILNFFKSGKNVCLGLDSITYDQNSEMPDTGKKSLRELYSFLGLSLSPTRQIHFAELFGTILKRSILYSSESRSSLSRTLLDCAMELRMNAQINYNQIPDANHEFDEKLISQAMSKSIEFVDELNGDGSNLSQFLFSLKNSNKFSEIEKFEKIKKAFEEIFSLENLSVDVLLEYQDEPKYGVWLASPTRRPKFTKIVVIDKNMGRHFPLDHVGSGIKEVIYLLTTAHGVKNSVLMLDEPAVSLHPPMMRAVLRHLENSSNENQFIIITHSPQLLQYEIFEAKGSVHYVKKLNHVSHIKSLNEDLRTAFEENRPKFKYQIDMRIFFGKCIILTEGQSDSNLLTGISQYFENTDKTLNLNTQDIIIISVDGKPNFKKYRQYLDGFDINYIILADEDAKSDIFRNEKFSLIKKDNVNGDGPVFLIGDKDLEHLMMEIDGPIFNRIKSKIGDSKPIVALEFAEEVSKRNPSALNSLKQILLKAVEIANN